MVKRLVRFTVWTIRSMPRDQGYQRQVSRMVSFQQQQEEIIYGKQNIDRQNVKGQGIM